MGLAMKANGFTIKKVAFIALLFPFSQLHLFHAPLTQTFETSFHSKSRCLMYKPLVFSLFAALLSVFVACDPNSSSNPSLNTPGSGNWKITYFFDKTDETSNYSGYTFEFGSNNSFKATRNGQTWSGSWSNNCDDSANKLCIFWSGSVPSALEELAEDWRVIEMNNDLIHLEHTSGGNGDTDVVHFKKA